MMELYKFTTKNGKWYYAMATNRTTARRQIETANRIDLTGAKYEEIYKNRVIETGIVK